MDTIVQKTLFGDDLSSKPIIGREELERILYPILARTSLDKLVMGVTNEFKEIIEYIQLREGKNTCQNTTLLFNPHRLETKTKNSKASIFDAIKGKDFVSGLSRAILFDKQYNKNKDYLFNSFRLGINGIQYVNEFQPYVARDLCKKYLLSTKSKVIDPCGGWGGRMLGVSVICNSYTCYEPATKTYRGLVELYKFIQNIDPSFNAEIINLPFEDGETKENYYDFAITSPPYYDTELYTDEQTNSLNRYPDFRVWSDLFYIPLIEKTLKSLKSNCFFVLNIGSRNYPLSEILYNNFGTKCEIKKLDNYLSGSGGLGKNGEGESFYSIRKM